MYGRLTQLCQTDKSKSFGSVAPSATKCLSCRQPEEEEEVANRAIEYRTDDRPAHLNDILHRRKKKKFP